MARTRKHTVTDTIPEVSSSPLTHIDTLVEATTATVDTYVAPVRKSVAQRYPGLFSILTTFGAATTFLGFEQIMLTSTLLQQHPFLILLIGVGILALTGTLYKKLS